MPICEFTLFQAVNRRKFMHIRVSNWLVAVSGGEETRRCDLALGGRRSHCMPSYRGFTSPPFTATPDHSGNMRNARIDVQIVCTPYAWYIDPV